MKSLKIILLLSTIFSYDYSKAQDSLVDYFVMTVDYQTEKKLKNSLVEIYDGDKVVFTARTGRSGKVETQLKPGKTYKLVVSNEGKVNRFMFVDLTGLNNTDVLVSGGCSFGMFDRVLNADYSYVENNPLTIIRYNPDSGSLEVDKELASKMSEEIKRINK